MKVKLLKNCKEGRPGDMAVVEAARAERMIGYGQAVPVRGGKAEGVPEQSPIRPAEQKEAELSKTQQTDAVQESTTTSTVKQPATKPKGDKAGGKSGASRAAGD